MRVKAAWTHDEEAEQQSNAPIQQVKTGPVLALSRQLLQFYLFIFLKRRKWKWTSKREIEVKTQSKQQQLGGDTVSGVKHHSEDEHHFVDVVFCSSSFTLAGINRVVEYF